MVLQVFSKLIQYSCCRCPLVLGRVVSSTVTVNKFSRFLSADTEHPSENKDLYSFINAQKKLDQLAQSLTSEEDSGVGNKKVTKLLNPEISTNFE